MVTGAVLGDDQFQANRSPRPQVNLMQLFRRSICLEIAIAFAVLAHTQTLAAPNFPPEIGTVSPRTCPAEVRAGGATVDFIAGQAQRSGFATAGCGPGRIYSPHRSALGEKLDDAGDVASGRARGIHKEQLQLGRNNYNENGL